MTQTELDRLIKEYRPTIEPLPLHTSEETPDEHIFVNNLLYAVDRSNQTPAKISFSNGSPDPEGINKFTEHLGKTFDEMSIPLTIEVDESGSDDNKLQIFVTKHQEQ